MKKVNSVLCAIAVMAIAVTAFADDVSVTVYNSNLGVIREIRDLSFDKGDGMVSFVDVPSLIDATSVGFELVDKNKSVMILEQNYAYDLVSPNKIYDKYIDRNIDVFNKEGEIFSGTLLSSSGGAVVLREKTGKIQIIRMDQVVNVNFPELPEGLITRPTLFWRYRSDFAGKTACQVSYQTSGLSWSAEYVGLLSDDEKTLGLTGWSSITNNSGATYKDATLKLIAGDINRVAQPRVRMMEDAMMEKAMAPQAGAGFEEKAFFEYHMYTLPRKATIANNEIKQIALFDPADAVVKKEYYYEPHKNNEKVRVAINFTNDKKDGLGIPLPAGRVRMFKKDTDGAMVLLGEDRIDHTPKDEEVKLTVGYAFDISAEEKQTEYNRISTRVEERTYEISLRNHKKEAVTIFVEKKLYGDWSITGSSHEYTNPDATTLKYEIPVPADGDVTVTFTVRAS